MKKVLLLLIFLMAISFTSISTNAKENGFEPFLNNNNVLINEKLHSKLITIGYSKQEIINLTQKKADEFKKMDIQFISKNEQYVETIYSYDGEKLIDVKNNVITKEEMENKLSKEKETKDRKIKQLKDDNTSLTASYNVMSDLTSTTANELEWDVWDDNGDSADYKLITTSAFWDNYNQQAFVRVNVKWLKMPKYRGTDLISISYNSDKYIVEQTQSPQKPIFDSKLIYQIANYDDRKCDGVCYGFNGPDLVIDAYTDYTQNCSSCEFKELNDGLVVQNRLPKDILHSYKNWLGIPTSDKYDEVLISLEHTLEARFDPTESDIIKSRFIGTHSHQTGNGNFYWDNVNLNFSATPPYLSVGTSMFFNNEANYDKEIFADVALPITIE